MENKDISLKPDSELRCGRCEQRFRYEDWDKHICASFYDPDARPVESIRIPERAGLPKLSQPSRWTCLPTSFAMVLSRHEHSRAGSLLTSIMEQLGRDDERGFHVQEFLGIAVTLGFAFVPVEFEPLLDRAMCHPCTGTGLKDYVVGSECPSCLGAGVQSEAPMVLWPLKDVMRDYDGVLVGKRKGAQHHHAVAWCRTTQMCLDPEEGIYSLDQFKPETFWAAMELRS